MGMSERTFGVEIECFGPLNQGALIRELASAGIEVYNPRGTSHRSYDNMVQWRVKTDCSIYEPNGYAIEIVSPILRGAEGIRGVQKVCRILETHEFDVNETCGIHVHLGAKDLTASEIYTLIKRYDENEPQIDAFINLARRANKALFALSTRAARIEVLKKYDRWKRSEGDDDVTEAIYCSCGCGQVIEQKAASNPFKDAKSLCSAADYHDRFCKVNTGAYFTHGTIEFRHYHGSINGNEITNWIKFLLNFMKQTRRLTTIRNSNGEIVSMAESKKDRGIYMGLRKKTREHFESQTHGYRLVAG